MNRGVQHLDIAASIPDCSGMFRVLAYIAAAQRAYVLWCPDGRRSSLNAVTTLEALCAVIPVWNVAQPEGVVTSPAVSNYVGTGEGDREWARLESLPGRGPLRLTAVNPVTGGAVARGRLKAPPKCGELNVIVTLYDREGGTVIGRQSVGQAQFGSFIDLEFRIPPERCETKLSFGLSPSSTAAKSDRHLKSRTPLARLSSEHWP